MKHIPGELHVPHSESELCLNRWYFVDDSGVVLRIAAKVYALSGSEEDKLAILHKLSAADHLTATMHMVPSDFILSVDGQDFIGAIPASAIHDCIDKVFEPLLVQLQKALPQPLHSIDDNYQSFALQIPDDYLCVTTAVYERQDGELVAMIGKNP